MRRQGCGKGPKQNSKCKSPELRTSLARVQVSARRAREAGEQWAEDKRLGGGERCVAPLAMGKNLKHNGETEAGERHALEAGKGPVFLPS